MTMRLASCSGSGRSEVYRAGCRGSSDRRRLAPRLWLLGSLALSGFGCASRPRPQDLQAAARNAASLYSAPEDPFGRPETGWAVYAPRIALSAGATGAADTPAFAGAVARWREAHGLGAGGEVDAPTLSAMKTGWQAARPFVKLRVSGVCPDPPPVEALAPLTPPESLGGRPLLLRRGALAAYRRMVRFARRREPTLASRPDLLQVFSAYRSPDRDTARCAEESNCQGVVRAACSAHRTGLAVDLVLDAAPGFAVDSSADANRLSMVRGLAYRWLLTNGQAFGFVNYGFEPWHWEWTGEPP